MSKNIPGRITATPTGLDVQAQTVTFGGVAYEIQAQVIAIEATDPAHFRLVLTADGLALDETPLGEEPEPIAGEVLTLASFDLQPGQPVDEAACFNVARREWSPSVVVGDAMSLSDFAEMIGRVQDRMDETGKPPQHAHDVFAPKKTVQTGQAQRRGPSPAQAARAKQRRDLDVIRVKLAEGRTLTPAEMSDALRALLGA